MYNGPRKLHLSCGDLPHDPDQLREGIGQLVETILMRSADMIPIVNLTLGEMAIVRYLVASREVTCGPRTAFPNRQASLLAHIRKKLGPLGIKIPARGQPMIASDKAKLTSLVKQAEAEAREEQNISRAKLEKILPFISASYEETQLPGQSRDLQIIALKLIGMLRGDPAAIRIQGVSAASEKIILSTLLARENGFATKEQLFVALYTPFADNPVLSGTVNTLLSRPRRFLKKEHDIDMTTIYDLGWRIDDVNRDRIYAIMNRNDPQAMPRQPSTRPNGAKPKSYRPARQ